MEISARENEMIFMGNEIYGRKRAYDGCNSRNCTKEIRFVRLGRAEFRFAQKIKGKLSMTFFEAKVFSAERSKDLLNGKRKDQKYFPSQDKLMSGCSQQE